MHFSTARFGTSRENVSGNFGTGTSNQPGKFAPSLSVVKEEEAGKSDLWRDSDVGDTICASSSQDSIEERLTPSVPSSLDESSSSFVAADLFGAHREGQQAQGQQQQPQQGGQYSRRREQWRRKTQAAVTGATGGRVTLLPGLNAPTVPMDPTGGRTGEGFTGFGGGTGVVMGGSATGTTKPFVSVPERDQFTNRVTGRHQSIAGMPEYKDMSFEECRWEDYQANRGTRDGGRTNLFNSRVTDTGGNSTGTAPTPAFTGFGRGTVTGGNSAAPTPAFTGFGRAAVTGANSVAPTPAFTGFGSGTVTGGNGAGTAPTPAFTGFGSGPVTGGNGAGTAPTPAFTGFGSGTVTGGNSAAPTPAFTGFGSGPVTGGNGAGTAPTPAFTGFGSGRVTGGNGAGTAPTTAFTGFGSGPVTGGNGAGTAPTPAFTGFGSGTVTGGNGAGTAPTPAFTGFGSGTETGGNGAVTTPLTVPNSVGGSSVTIVGNTTLMRGLGHGSILPSPQPADQQKQQHDGYKGETHHHQGLLEMLDSMIKDGHEESEVVRQQTEIPTPPLPINPFAEDVKEEVGGYTHEYKRTPKTTSLWKPLKEPLFARDYERSSEILMSCCSAAIPRHTEPVPYLGFGPQPVGDDLVTPVKIEIHNTETNYPTPQVVTKKEENPLSPHAVPDTPSTTHPSSESISFSAASSEEEMAESPRLSGTLQEAVRECIPSPQSPPSPGPLSTIPWALAPVLTKEGYTCLPSVATLRQMTEEEVRRVPDFTVERPGVGSICWPGFSDLTGVDLDGDVWIEEGTVDVYGGESFARKGGDGCDDESEGKPPKGRKLNKTARVQILCRPPQQLCEKIRNRVNAGGDWRKEVRRVWENKLRKFCEKQGSRFLRLDGKKWMWEFEVPHF
uniref:Peptidase S59 domain-containing protein n=1 Tax=Chromera velia CCMP2878 TaxID=1169474 RepID=A0A0G4HVL9_9ALVE|eukprot:Cvel_1405.t1-p1 / transcript=Cvel_1405.t1 / gene=Cvel_1405 / organism=Chromera_velia_CCMP2878 / gene_product=Nuclear pore complex protein Nup98-Nup96, putative / transcript_product=Nuclear pore complex protein Nup98-Nup96, putative / location=Cvel_scaffold49:47597-50269(-) / protein_length=891 / sequence_SO=supercontig / SO=protein_coding / is_pseudo=false